MTPFYLGLYGGSGIPGAARFEHLLLDLAEGGRETAGAYRKAWR